MKVRHSEREAFGILIATQKELTKGEEKLSFFFVLLIYNNTFK